MTGIETPMHEFGGFIRTRGTLQPYLLTAGLFVSCAFIAAPRVTAQPARPTGLRFSGDSGFTQLTVSLGGTGSGTVKSNVSGINCPTVCSATYNTGAFITLTASAAAGSTFAGWSGACTGTGACVVSTNSNQTATATFNVNTTGNCTGPFSITNQEPTSCVPYPNAFVSKQLPGAGSGGPPTNHWMSGSASMVNWILAANANGSASAANNASTNAMSVAKAPSNNEGSHVTSYYGQQPTGCSIGAAGCDPSYKLVNCKGQYSGYSGTIFHAPSQAEFSSNCMGQASCTTFDAVLSLWDQKTGKTISVYAGGFGTTASFYRLPACPGGGHAGTDADPCPFDVTTVNGSGYCEVSDRVTGTAYHAGPVNSNGMPIYAGEVRYQELIAGKISHALYLNGSCRQDTTVFPANDGGSTARTCSSISCTSSFNGNSFAPSPNGALYFLDYTTSQLATLKASLPSWQYAFLEAMTLYGGYLGDTGGCSPSLTSRSLESGQAYYFYDNVTHQYPGAYTGTTSPDAGYFYNWMHNNCGTNCAEGGIQQFKNIQWVMLWLQGVPTNIPGPTCSSSQAGNNQCGIAKHMHVADQCVTIALAGLSSFGGVNACP